MPAPFTPEELQLTLPAASKTTCQKLRGLPEFFALYLKFQKYFVAETGGFNEEAGGIGEDFCQLACIRGGGVTDECLELDLVATTIGSDGAVTMTVHGAGVMPGFTYHIYIWAPHTLPVGDPGGAYIELATGTTEGSQITFKATDALAFPLTADHIVNDHEYGFKVTIQNVAAGCPLYEVEFDGTPLLCMALSPALSLSIGIDGNAALTITGLPTEPTFLVSWYLSTISGEIGLPRTPTGGKNETTGNYEYTDSGLTVGTRYWYTARIQEKAGCPSFDVTANAIAGVAGDTPTILGVIPSPAGLVMQARRRADGVTASYHLYVDPSGLVPAWEILPTVYTINTNLAVVSVAADTVRPLLYRTVRLKDIVTGKMSNGVKITSVTPMFNGMVVP